MMIKTTNYSSFKNNYKKNIINKIIVILYLHISKAIYDKYILNAGKFAKKILLVENRYKVHISFY